MIKGPIDNESSSLVRNIAWRRTGEKPLPEAMMTSVHGAMWRPKVTMS